MAITNVSITKCFGDGYLLVLFWRCTIPVAITTYYVEDGDQGLPGVFLGSSWCLTRVLLGSDWGLTGSSWGLPGVFLGSYWGLTGVLLGSD